MSIIPVSLTEADLFSSRMGQVDLFSNTVVDPFLSLYSSEKLTQIIYSEGVGRHSIMGLSIDTSIERAISSFANEIKINLMSMP